MKNETEILTLRIDTSEPIRLEDFVGAFTSISDEFRREIKRAHPEIDAEPEIYIQEVRKGSYEADLLPLIGAAAPLIAQMDQLLVADEFVRTWGRRLNKFISGNLGGWSPGKSELESVTNAVQAIAKDPSATSTLSAVRFRDGKRQVEAEFTFSTSEAISAQRTIDATYQELQQPDHSDRERVLMVFTRSDIGNVSVGKRSGERVKIEEIAPKALALMYASDLAEEKIKHEIRDAEDNVYKKGFVVDVNVKLINGKPSVYAVTNLHEIIELPDT